MRDISTKAGDNNRVSAGAALCLRRVHCRAGTLNHQVGRVITPPSTMRAIPVIHRARSEHRNTQASPHVCGRSEPAERHRNV